MAADLGAVVTSAFRWRRRGTKPRAAVAGQAGTLNGGKKGSLKYSASCGLCGRGEVTVPYLTDCGHVYCYVCLRGACGGEERWRCEVCDTVVTGSRRIAVKGD